ncbi:hypothetical protein NSERKGN1266_73880 [Nocardia seriolae]|nr:hypothetical protein NSERKGN1266_73880 [Nocardia seriolae]
MRGVQRGEALGVGHGGGVETGQGVAGDIRQIHYGGVDLGQLPGSREHQGGHCGAQDVRDAVGRMIGVQRHVGRAGGLHGVHGGHQLRRPAQVQVQGHPGLGTDATRNQVAGKAIHPLGEGRVGEIGRTGEAQGRGLRRAGGLRLEHRHQRGRRIHRAAGVVPVPQHRVAFARGADIHVLERGGRIQIQQLAQEVDETFVVASGLGLGVQVRVHLEIEEHPLVVTVEEIEAHILDRAGREHVQSCLHVPELQAGVEEHDVHHRAEQRARRGAALQLGVIAANVLVPVALMP